MFGLYAAMFDNQVPLRDQRFENVVETMMNVEFVDGEWNPVDGLGSGNKKS